MKLNCPIFLKSWQMKSPKKLDDFLLQRRWHRKHNYLTFWFNGYVIKICGKWTWHCLLCITTFKLDLRAHVAMKVGQAYVLLINKLEYGVASIKVGKKLSIWKKLLIIAPKVGERATFYIYITFPLLLRSKISYRWMFL